MLVLLLTRQRTGSGALGTIMHRHPELYNTGEILHPSDPENKLNFFSYLRSNPKHMTAFADPETREKLVGQYFKFLEMSTNGRRPILDVKYRSLHHWDLGWLGLFEQPWLIAHVKHAGIPVLHLLRRNHAATYVSGLLAEANQVWHTSDPKKIKITSLKIKPSALIGFCENSVREVAQVRKWLGKYERVLSLEYEAMLDSSGNMPEKVATELASFLGIAPFSQLNSIFSKQAPAQLSDCIQNFDEVAVALRGTEFSWMLGES